MTLPFVRMHGCGNDFVVLDDRTGRLHPRRSALARAVCHRRTGLGGDGLILIGSPPRAEARRGAGHFAADFAMTYINADGNEGEMCGNGARCAASRAAELGIVGDKAVFATPAGPIRATMGRDGVTLSMTPPTDERPPCTLEIAGRRFDLHYIDTGVPHVVAFVDDLDELDVEGIGRTIRHHEAFAPRGVNANFAASAGPSRLRARTYERGVEAETLACGTGAVAIALVAFRRGLVQPPVTVLPPGGELVVGFRTGTGGGFEAVTLAGPTERIASGELDDSWLSARGLDDLTAAAA